MLLRRPLAWLFAALLAGGAVALPSPARAGGPDAALLPGVDLNDLEEDWELDAALAQAELFLGEREHALGPDDPEIASALTTLGVLYRQRRAYGRAEPLLQRALAMREKALGPEHPVVADVVHALAILYRRQRAYDRAELALLRALAIRQKALGPRHPLVAATLDDLGLLYRRTCLYGRAEKIFDEALAIREAALGPEHPDVAATQNHLAMLYWARGDLARGEALLVQALAIRRKALGEGHRAVAVTLKNLAVLERDRGEYELAERRFEEARAIFERALGPEHPDVARALFNLARLYRKRDRVDLAEPLLERARAIAERALGPTHTDVAACLGELGVIASKRGAFAQAEPLLQRAIAILERSLGPEHPDVAEAQSNLALMYLWKGEVTRARPLLARALATQEKALGPEHLDVARTLSALAGFYTIRGNLADAVAARARGAEIRDRHAELILSTGAEEQKRAYMDTLQKDTDALISLHLLSAPGSEAAARAALTTVLRRKGRALEAMTDSLLTLRRNLTPEARALLDRRAGLLSELAALASGGGEEGMTAEERLARARELDRERQRIDAQVSHLSAAFRAERRLVSIEQVAEALPAGGALLEIVRYEPFYPAPGRVTDHRGAPRYALYRLDRAGKVAAVDLGEASRIDEAVAELRWALSNPTHEPRALARALDELVMLPARRLLGDTRAVWVSPDGELNLVPFGALLDEAGRYLIDRYCFTYLTSGRDLLRLGASAPAREGPVVVANPDFGPPAPQGALEGNDGLRGGGVDLRAVTFPPLPGTAAEAKTLAARLAGARVLTGSAATERKIKALTGPLIVHIATHGFFLEAPGAKAAHGAPRGRGAGGELPATPVKLPVEGALLRAGLAFAGANEHRTGDDDGVLTALEAAALDLYGTKLIVLSACETGIGEVRSGDGVYGLRRALVMTGAETQVMSLWKVDDEATRLLMGAYYTKLEEGAGRGEGMREVQRAIRGQGSTAHPYFWAGFIVSGAASPLAWTPRAAAPQGEVTPGPRGRCACALVGEGEPGGRAGGAAFAALALGAAALTARSGRRARR